MRRRSVSCVALSHVQQTACGYPLRLSAAVRQQRIVNAPTFGTGQVRVCLACLVCLTLPGTPICMYVHTGSRRSCHLLELYVRHPDHRCPVPCPNQPKPNMLSTCMSDSMFNGPPTGCKIGHLSRLVPTWNQPDHRPQPHPSDRAASPLHTGPGAPNPAAGSATGAFNDCQERQQPTFLRLPHPSALRKSGHHTP